MQFSSSLYQIRSWLEPQLGKYRIPDIVMLNRSTPRAPTWRPTRGPTRERSRTAAAGRDVTGSLLGLTSWRDTTENTRGWSPSSVTSVIGLLPGVTTWVFIWRDTDSQEVLWTVYGVISYSRVSWYFLDVIWSFKPRVVVYFITSVIWSYLSCWVPLRLLLVHQCCIIQIKSVKHM